MVIQSLWSAAGAMQAQQLKVDTIANNLANVNTVGFKASRVAFQDLLYFTPAAPGQAWRATAGTAGAGRVEVGTGVVPVATVRDMTQGALESTEREWDLAVDGGGFFQVRLGDGTTGYTRDGSFRVSAGGDGELSVVDAAGNPLLDASGQPLRIPSAAVRCEVDGAGNVTAILADGNTQQVGQIGLAVFPNPAGLEGRGGNVFVATAASGQAAVVTPGKGGAGELRQGYLERSNVEVVTEMVSLIVAQRAYELSSKAVQSSDQMLEIANNLRR